MPFFLFVFMSAQCYPASRVSRKIEGDAARSAMQVENHFNLTLVRDHLTELRKNFEILDDLWRSCQTANTEVKKSICTS